MNANSEHGVVHGWAEEPREGTVHVGRALLMLLVAFLIFGLGCWLLYSHADRTDWVSAHTCAENGVCR